MARRLGDECLKMNWQAWQSSTADLELPTNQWTLDLPLEAPVSMMTIPFDSLILAWNWFNNVVG